MLWKDRFKGWCVVHRTCDEADAWKAQVVVPPQAARCRATPRYQASLTFGSRDDSPTCIWSSTFLRRSVHLHPMQMVKGVSGLEEASTMFCMGTCQLHNICIPETTYAYASPSRNVYSGGRTLNLRSGGAKKFRP